MATISPPAEQVIRVPDRVLDWPMAFRALRAWLTNYRRTWRGTIFTSVVNPVLYLGALGLGLGSLVNKHTELDHVHYLVFLAPGLLAAAAMETAIGESTYPILGSIKWLKTYQAAVASPMRPADLFHGHLLFVTMRLIMNSVIFLVVMVVFGAVHSPGVLAAIPVAVLTGLAFATPMEAWAITRDKDQAFSLVFRFVMIPLFLFSGTFFPITQLPGWIQPVAYVTPLWHGVALCRALSLGTADLSGALVHVAYLVALTLAGIAVGRRTYWRRLYV